MVILTFTLACSQLKPHQGRGPQGLFGDVTRYCVDLVKSLLPLQPKYYSKKEILTLKDFLSHNDPQYLITQRIGFRDDLPIAGFFLSTLPEELLKLLKELPSNSKQIAKRRNELVKFATLNHNHNFYQLINGLFDYYKFHDEVNVEGLIERSIRKFDELTSIGKKELFEGLAKKTLSKKAAINWRDHYKGILYIVETNEGTRLKVGDKLYPFRIKGDNMEVHVPQEDVKIDGQNPIETGKTQSLVNNPGSSHKSKYQGHLLPDGFFYCVDGNHRRSMFDRRKKIWIVLPNRLETLNLRDYVTLMGGLQPSDDLLIQLYQGEVEAIDIISDQLRRRLAMPIER